MATHPSPRQTPDGRTLASRHVVAFMLGRHVNLVRRVVEPVACDVASRAVLLDVAEADKSLALLPRRERR